MWSARKIRESWIRFFGERGYVDVSDRSLIPGEEDKSLLFINSGVAAIKGYFCGGCESNSRFFSAQRVIRTGDIDSIGESFRHHTYFEMLGNFIIGGASREEAIGLAWEFLKEILEMDMKRIYVTVYEEDEETFGEWRKYLDEGRIIRCGKGTNFWDMGVGPCGPCTEIYFDRGEKYGDGGIEWIRDEVENERYLEIWNLVFSDYLNVDGKIVASGSKNLDTGSGLERLLMVLEGEDNSFGTSLFKPIVGYLWSECGNIGDRRLWAAADYFRTTLVLIRDGVEFGNKGGEYVMRKLFRRGCECVGGRLSEGFFRGLAEVISGTLDYYGWSGILGRAIEMWTREYGSMKAGMERNEAILEGILKKYGSEIPAEEVFGLVTRDGMPYQYLEYELLERGVNFDGKEYERLFEEHRKKSLNTSIAAAFRREDGGLVEGIVTRFNYVDEYVESRVMCLYGDGMGVWDGNPTGGMLYVVLDTTVVFPEAAGQEEDWGTISFYHGVNMIEKNIERSIYAKNGQILHGVRFGKEEQMNLRAGTSMGVSHNKNRRRKIAMSHTAEHLLYSILGKMYGKIERHSGHKGEGEFSLEITVPEGIDRGSFDLVKINEKLNEAIWKEIEVKTWWGDLEEAKEMGIVGKYIDVYERSKDNLRFVGLGEYGTELCVGTHVNNTKEIEGAILVGFSKEKRNVFRFDVVVGMKDVNRVMGEIKDIGEYMESIFNREEHEKKKRMEVREEFGRKKDELREQLKGEGRFRVIEKECELDVAMAVIREMRGVLKDQVVVLHWSEGGNIRFMVAGEGVDIGGCWETFREKGIRCGGNENFGSGLCGIEEFGWVVGEIRNRIQE